MEAYIKKGKCKNKRKNIGELNKKEGIKLWKKWKKEKIIKNERNLRKSVDNCQTIIYNKDILKINFHIDILMKERYSPPKTWF